MVTRARAQVAARVALAADDDRTATEVARLCAERGIPFDQLTVESAIAAPVGAIAYAPSTPPDAPRAAELARLCAAAAENRRPVVLLALFERARGRAAEERAAALAFLRAHGAIPVEDPDTWFETVILVAAYGPPAGGRVAIVAPPGGWLSLQAMAQGGGNVTVHDGDGPRTSDPVDVVLVDGRIETAPERVGHALVVPVVARAELMPEDGRTPLVGLRAALGAASAAARHGERMREGLGPAAAGDSKRLKVDRARADKALAGAGERLGDHEAKLLLSAYGASVTRQAVAGTPSAAVRYAQTLGWPVEIKPWDPTRPSEREGTVVIEGVRNPPDVRRAFGSAATDNGLEVGVPVIVRATPPPGRELMARVEKLGALGWTVFLDLPAMDRVAAAPAPLRRVDGEELAAALESSRSGDAPFDRAALADLLVRASFAAVEQEAVLDVLSLGRIVVGKKGEGAMVVDAGVKMRKKDR